MAAGEPLVRGAGASKRRRWLRIGRVLPIALVLAIGIFLLTPTGCYLGRAGWEEAKILAGRRSIRELVSSNDLDSLTRGKLQLVLAARDFAEDSLQLNAGESFTMFTRLERDTLLLLLSAARRDALVPHTWWFPIVGRVPYKGYFDFEAAREAARELDVEGYDINLRPASAFSTLGWFNDPLLSTTLRQDSADLVNTVIHEITHNTFYAPDETVFNESFASFVGARGAAAFFRSRGDSASAARVDARWTSDKVMARFWAGLYAELDSAFRAHRDDREARLAVRDTVYARARERLRSDIAPQLGVRDERWADRVRLDNAVLLARRVYMTDLEVYDRVLERMNGDVRAAVATIVELASGEEEPFAAVRAWLAAGASGGGPPGRK
jgi:predicted aminopeptidase